MDRLDRTYWLQRATREDRLPRRGRAAPRAGALVLMLGLFGLFVSVGGFFMFTAAAATATAAWYDTFVQDFPSVATVDSRDVFKTTRILDRNGELLYELFDQDEGKRTVIRLGDMPEILIQAFLAVEDATFFDNPGIEPRGIARAFMQNLRAGTIVSGGSTITQQLIRNVLLDPKERSSETLDRKLKEAVLAVELSGSYSKQQILEWYLNEIYFGNLSYGVATAAKTYFNKQVRELTLPEVAFLAGLPQAPGYYDPFTNFSSAKLRQEEVLELMAHHRFVSSETAEAAKEEPIQLVPSESETTIKYPHWVFYVRSVLEERYGAKGLLAAGLTVYTTIDPSTQAIAEEAIARNRLAIARQNANNAAMVAIDPWAGEILAMVGSADYYDPRIDGQVNNAVSLHQPGSSIKPIVYLTAFLKGFAPSTMVQDAPISFPDWTGRVWAPQNHDNRFRGPITLRRALGNSLNIPAVKVLQYAGLEETVSLAKRLGMTSLGDASTYGLAFTLGGAEVRLVELASAYTVLANTGLQVPVSPILKILDGDGKVVFEHKPARHQAVDPRVAFMINDILSDNSARTDTFGANSPLRLRNRAAAAKTGTSDDYRDTWTLGYTPSLVAGVWVGRSDNAPTRFVPNSSAAPLIWNTFMERALEGLPSEPFEGPPGLKQERVCMLTGLPGGDCSQISDWFLEERAPSTLARLSARALALDRATGKLADRDTPYTDILFRTYRVVPSGDGPHPPTEYSDRAGVNRPWEVLPATILPTMVPTPVGTPTPAALSSGVGEARAPTLAAIWSPRSGEVVSGEIAIQGSATAADFRSYRLEYQLRDNATDDWITLRETSRRSPITNGELDRWNTTDLSNGLYSIQLTVTSSIGVASQTRAIVTVRNSDG